jgi:hypothetical protein
MSLDAFTISAISVVLLLAVLLVIVSFVTSRATQSRVAALERSLPAPKPTPARVRGQRELCGAIHRLHPNARVGVDFHVKDDGQGPAIAEWLLPTPQPTKEQLETAMTEYLREQQDEAYREARLAEYPSIGDQMDALYKARQGDPAELAAVDARIHEVKARHPKPGQC